MNFVPGTARKVLAQFSPERVFFVLAYTVREREYDTRITGHNQSWAKTVPLYGMKSGRGDCTLESHSAKVDLFIDAVQHEYLLSLSEVRRTEPRTATDHVKILIDLRRQVRYIVGTVPAS